MLNEKTGDGEQRQAFDLVAKLDPSFVPTAALTATGGERLSLVEALLFALLGGLILNLMPCVFPVLAMKAAAFARLAGHERSACAATAWPTRLGVLAAFAAMAAVVVAIRASVGDVSWGFQFQSPIFSLLIAYLFFVVGLNLAGVFEIGGSFAGHGPGPDREHRRQPAPSSPACWRSWWRRPAPRRSWPPRWASRSASRRRRPWRCCWRWGSASRSPSSRCR